MVLAIDIGNTNIVVGAFDDDSQKSLFFERLRTNTQQTPMEYAFMFRKIFDIYDMKPEQVDGAILSSVVPAINRTICEAVKTFAGVDTIIVSAGIKTGIKMHLDTTTIGADLIVGAVAGAKYYPVPQIIIDMGTATTVSALDREGVFIGKMILPGVRVALDGLVGKTAQLPTISLEEPKNLIGKTTVESIQGGIMYGNAGQLDGIIDRMEEQLGPCTIVATGGLAGVITPLCRHEIILDDDLLLKGLMLLYKLNK